MRKLKMSITTLVMVLAGTPVFAVDAAMGGSSGILALVVLGIGALIVLFQMIPAIIMLCGMIKGLMVKG